MDLFMIGAGIVLLALLLGVTAGLLGFGGSE